MAARKTNTDTKTTEVVAELPYGASQWLHPETGEPVSYGEYRTARVEADRKAALKELKDAAKEGDATDG